MLVDIKPGFRLLTDLSSLESMAPSCATGLGEMMNLCNAKGISAALKLCLIREKTSVLLSCRNFITESS